MESTHKNGAPPIRASFLNWKDVYAADDPKLARLVRETRSDSRLLADLALAILFLVFCYVTIRQSATSVLSPPPKISDLTQAALRETRKETRQPSPRRREASEAIAAEIDGSPKNTRASARDLRAPNREASSVKSPIRTPVPPAEVSPRIQTVEAEPFLQHLQEQVRAAQESLRNRERVIGANGRIVFAALAAAGGATLLFALGGAVLVLLDRLAPGVVVESIAVIPAAGTLIFWRLYRSLGKQRANIANELSSHVRTLQAIQVVLAVPDHSKRSDAMVGLSTRLMEWHHVTSDAG